ncbi:MAG: flavin reductase family protein, partial [Thauera sp.]|nr:flavin reductase family protein [Thauera sp.]
MKTRPAVVSVDEYKNAMRHVVSPVAVVTYRHKAGWGGMTVTAICSATTEPPTLVVCLRNDKPVADRVREAGSFVVNSLTDEQADVARLFSSPPHEGRDAFDRGQWTEGQTGAPVLMGAVSSFECSVAGTMEQGCNTIFLGEVLALRV